MVINIIVDAVKHNERRNGDKTPVYWYIGEVIPDTAKSTGYALEYRFDNGLIRTKLSVHWWDDGSHIFQILKNGITKGSQFVIEVDSDNINDYGRIDIDDVISIKPLNKVKQKTYNVISK